MISITPQGTISLCKTPLENDYNHQLTFSNATAQQTYFNSTVFKTATDYTYMKKDNAIKVDYNIDEIIGCNYLFYKNTGFSSKWYYCFITNMEYVNENCTKLYIETDVFQTYQFDLVKKACFVEREHVNDDSFGLHTVPEGLETGDYICSDYVEREIKGTGAFGYIIIGLSNLVENFPTPQTSVYNGVYSGLTYYVLENGQKATQFIKALMEAWEYDASQSINCLFIVPRELINVNNISWQTGTIGNNTLEFGILPTTTEPQTFANVQLNHGTQLDHYTPKNNKLFTYPYNYILATNNSGQTASYNFEDFLEGYGSFEIEGVVSVGCSIRMDPRMYKNGFFDADDPSTIIDNRRFKSYGLSCGKFPTCSWNCDAYTNWLTTNATNFVSEAMGGLLKAGIGVATSNPYLAAEGVIDSISTAVEAATSHDTLPNQAQGNINTGDVLFAGNNLGFSFYRMTVKQEYAKIIDDYFSMFGYKVNTVKIPNFTGRTNWNYIKTIACNFEGNIPQMYLNKIKDIFNKGITLWHNPSTMLDYTQSNTIIS